MAVRSHKRLMTPYAAERSGIRHHRRWRVVIRSRYHEDCERHRHEATCAKKNRSNCLYSVDETGGEKRDGENRRMLFALHVDYARHNSRVIHRNGTPDCHTRYNTIKICREIWLRTHQERNVKQRGYQARRNRTFNMATRIQHVTASLNHRER